MNENHISMLLVLFFIVSLFGGLFLVIFIGIEQEHKHQIEIEKAKHGVFNLPSNKESIFKKNCKQIIFILILSILIIAICYIFEIPSDLPKYILDVIK